METNNVQFNNNYANNNLHSYKQKNERKIDTPQRVGSDLILRRLYWVAIIGTICFLNQQIVKKLLFNPFELDLAYGAPDNSLLLIMNIVFIIFNICFTFAMWLLANESVFRKRTTYKKDISIIMRKLTIYIIIVCGILICYNIYTYIKENNIYQKNIEYFSKNQKLEEESFGEYSKEIEISRKSLNNYIKTLKAIQIVSIIGYVMQVIANFMSLIFERKQLEKYTILY